MQRKYQIFISSTFADLVDERRDAMRCVLDLGHIPAGMELFPASDTEQLNYIKKIIDECDYYVLIVGGRYGSISEDGISFTEREYDYAVKSGKVVLAFLHNDPNEIPLGKSEISAAARERLTQFRSKVSSGRLILYWSSRDQLSLAIMRSLSKALIDDPQTGWVRGDAAASEDILAQINDLRVQNEKLKADNEWYKSALKPRLVGLASVYSTFRINFNYITRISGKDARRSASTEMTWAEIFCAVGPSLLAPTSPYTLHRTLNIYLANTRPLRAVHVSETDVATIKIQLMGYQFISSKSAGAKSGGIMEFVQVTDLGRKTLLELVTLKDGIAETPAVITD